MPKTNKSNINQAREKWMNSDSEELFQAILALRNGREAKRFFRDLLTENELLEFGRRWRAARMLDRQVPYSEIGRQTWLSPRTIARIQKWVKGGRGGYRLMIDRLAHS